jgi:hypothetical protein
MNPLTDRQRTVLHLGLDAFDRSARRRRRFARVARTGLAAGLMMAILAIALDATRPARAQIPRCVEFITTDGELAGALRLAHACEHVERSGGRLRVVECIALAPPVPGTPPGR